MEKVDFKMGVRERERVIDDERGDAADKVEDGEAERESSEVG